MIQLMNWSTNDTILQLEERNEHIVNLIHDLINNVMDWCSCNDEKECQNFIDSLSDIFVGEFLKSILKIKNISKEIEKIAEYLEDMELLQKLKNIPDKIMKFIVTTDSLYL